MIVSKNLLTFILLSLLIFTQACREKGCTDPTALNYNIVAEEDDGTCVHCKMLSTTRDSIFEEIFDNNFSSPHQGDMVAKIYLFQEKTNYNFTECSENDCRLSVIVESLVPETTNLTCTLQVTGSFINFIMPLSISVPGYSIANAGELPPSTGTSDCASLLNVGFFVSAVTLNYQ